MNECVLSKSAFILLMIEFVLKKISIHYKHGAFCIKYDCIHLIKDRIFNKYD